jgi:LysR family nitrogen assimilation transcriptional regulator
LELLQLQYFVRVAEQGSFSDAGALLEVAQPTLSRKIRALEVELRTALFHRNGRGAQLTPAGRRLLDHARGVLRGAESLMEAVRESDTAFVGRVVAGLPPGVGKRLIPALVAGFTERFPKAFLSIVEGLSDSLYEQLRAGHLDFAVMRNPSASAHVSIEAVTTEALYVVGAKPLKSRGQPIALSDLVGVPFIMPSAPHSIRPLIDAAMARMGASLNIICEVDAVGSLIDLAAAGLGYTMIPESTIGSFSAASHLCFHKIAAPELSTTLCLVTPSRQPRTQLPVEAARLAREVLVRELGLDRSAKASAHKSGMDTAAAKETAR